MGEVLAAAAASAEWGESLFQERAHVVGLAGRLSEDKRGLGRIGGEQSDYCGSLAGEFLGEELEEVEVAAGEGANDELAAVGFGSFG